ncbi:MAG: TetR/AcrR family transcriptional regulator [Cypionkella sp.]
MSTSEGPAASKTGKTITACPRQGRYAAGCDLQKRDQILEGAHRIFSRMGYDAASMNDITREAQVSKGTIYVYFSSKEELFEALIERERGVLFAGIESALMVPGPVADKLKAFAAAIIRVLCSDTVIRAHRIVIGVIERMPELGLRFYERGPLRTNRLFQRYLQEEVARGTLVIADIDLAAAQFAELATAGLFRRRLFGEMSAPPTEAEISRNTEATVAMFLGLYGA